MRRTISPSSTKLHCQTFDQAGRKFASIPELVAAVKLAHQQAARDQREILEYLSSPDCKIFKITAPDVARLYCESGAGKDTLQNLKALNDAYFTTSSVVDLIAPVKQAHERQLLKDHLQRPKCTLFSNCQTAPAKT